MRWKEKVVAGYLVFIIINLAIIDYLVWKGVKPQVLNEGLPSDVAQALLLSFSILLTIFILIVYLEQSKFMEKQTKIFEVDKLPMLIFRKVDSSQDGETQDKNQENNVNSIENQENGIQVGEHNLAFEIINVSKYPVRVKCVDFIPSEKYKEIHPTERLHEGRESGVPPQAVRLHTLFGVEGKLIPPDQKIKVPDKGEGEADITVPGVLRIKASNVFFPDDFSLEYEYEISSGRFRLVEEGFQIGYKGRNNMSASIEYFYEFANKFTPYLVIYSAMMTVSIALMAFSDKLAKLTPLENWVFALIGFLFGLSGILTLIGLAFRVWSEIKLFRALRDNLVRLFAFLSFLLPSCGLILFFLLLFKEVLVRLL